MERYKQTFAFLLAVGSAIFLSSLIDYVSLIFPLHLSDSQWVFLTTQEVSDKAVIPILGLLFLFMGLYLYGEKKKLLLNMEKLLSVFSLLFGIMLISFTLLYSLSFNSVQSKMLSSIKEKAAYSKIKINTVLEQKKAQVSALDKIKIDNYLKDLDKNLALETKQAKQAFFVKNIKILSNLILFILAYIFLGIWSFKSSGNALKELAIKKS